MIKKSIRFAELTNVGASLDGGIFAGISTRVDDRHFAVVLLPEQGSNLTHAKARAWAKKQGGEVAIKFSFSKVPGASQVICAHQIKFTRPTADGKASEEVTRKTSMHVGRFGRMSIVPETHHA